MNNRNINMKIRKLSIIWALLFSLFLTGSLHAADQFTVSPVYLQDYMRNDEGRDYRFQGPGLNASFFRDGNLDLIFSFTAGLPVWLSEDGSTHLSYDYYSNPASFHLLAGPVWSFPMGKKMIFEPSLGLQAGFITMKGSGYSSLQFAPLGIGTDLRLKLEINPKLIVGLMGGFNWNILDIQHFADHDTGYSITAGISAGFRFESERVEKKRRNKE
jgi:hypothetical protein